jgi:hypothetical protein
MAMAADDVVGDYIDQLVSIEMRNRAMPRGMMRPLYAAARTAQGNRPLASLAAELLLGRVRSADRVVIVTGAGVPPLLPKGESDGPPGAAVLGRILQLGRGAVPVFLCEARHADPVIACASVAGIPVREYDTTFQLGHGSALLIAPADDAEVERWARQVIDEVRPSAVISIERLGPNSAGVMHNATGVSRGPPQQVDLAPVIEIAREGGIATLAIGDVGNEIGFGVIADAVRDHQPYGSRCRCPCGQGIACTTLVDILVVAAISNWGAYGIEAALCAMLDRPGLQHGPVMARRLIERCLETGGYEARFGSESFMVDGVDGEVSVSVEGMLVEMVRIATEAADPGPLHGDRAANPNPN